MFPADAAKWFEHSRAMRVTRPDQQREWEIKGLPAGDYLAVALEYVDDAAWNDPDYLESLRRVARPVKLRDGSTERLMLTVAMLKQ